MNKVILINDKDNTEKFENFLDMILVDYTSECAYYNSYSGTYRVRIDNVNELQWVVILQCLFMSRINWYEE